MGHFHPTRQRGVFFLAGARFFFLKFARWDIFIPPGKEVFFFGRRKIFFFLEIREMDPTRQRGVLTDNYEIFFFLANSRDDDDDDDDDDPFLILK